MEILVATINIDSAAIPGSIVFGDFNSVQSRVYIIINSPTMIDCIIAINFSSFRT